MYFRTECNCLVMRVVLSYAVSAVISRRWQGRLGRQYCRAQLPWGSKKSDLLLDDPGRGLHRLSQQGVEPCSPGAALEAGTLHLLSLPCKPKLLLLKMYSILFDLERQISSRRE